MAYKFGEKKYLMKIEIRGGIEFLWEPYLKSTYEEMCLYHNKVITDRKHIYNYLNQRVSGSISKADMDWLMKKIEEYNTNNEEEGE